MAHPSIIKKITERHGLSTAQVVQAFINRGKVLADTRTDNQTTPPTLFVIAPDNKGNLIKVVFIVYAADETAVLKTAYSPNQEEIDFYHNNTS